MEDRIYPVTRNVVAEWGGIAPYIEGRDIIIHSDEWRNGRLWKKTLDRVMHCTLRYWQDDPVNEDERCEVCIHYTMDTINGCKITQYDFLTSDRPPVFGRHEELAQYKEALLRICRWNMDSSIRGLRIAYDVQRRGGDHD